MTADPFAPFLRAVLEQPDDDLPRLVAADALSAGDYGGPRDEARAEFIRVQVELARLQADHRRRCVGTITGDMESAALRRRERELLVSDYGRGWRNFGGRDLNLIVHNPLPWTEVFTFRRGFVASLTLPCADLLKHAAAVFGAAPVEEVRVSDREPMLRRSRSRWRWWRRVRLDTGRDDLEVELFDLLSSKRPRRGRVMNAWYDSADDALADLSRAAVKFGRHAAGLPAREPAGWPASRPVG